MPPPLLLLLLLLLNVAALCARGSVLHVSKASSNSSSSVSSSPRSAFQVTDEATPFHEDVRVHSQHEEAEPRTGIYVEMVADSVEQEQLLGLHTGGSLGAGLPVLTSPRHKHRRPLDFAEEDEDMSDEAWAYGQPIRADGSLLEPLPQTNGQSDDDIINVEFHDHLPTQLPSYSHPEEQQGGDPTSWTLSDFYEYLSPDFSTTEVYPDEDDLPTVSDMEDENGALVSATVSSKPRVFVSDADSASSGDTNAAAVAPSGALDTPSGCRQGYVRSNGTCRSPCDVLTDYCYNGGQCYEVEGIGAFCRCNMQEYLWNKGPRCESVVTDFQIMCLVVGGASLVLLLLFMIIVFFAKRLHLLKAENSRLRRRSKYRPHSGTQQDNVSVSTVAEGSQANVRSVSDSPSELKHEHTLAYYDNVTCQDDPAKVENPLKSSPTKEEESLNIQNSFTSAQDNKAAAGDMDHVSEEGVTINLELLLPKEAKLHPQTSPPLHYNVFLYKLPKSPVTPLPHGHARNAHLCSRRGSEPGYSPVSTRSLPPLQSRKSNPRLGKACTP
ncbi:chondroitin sulfate proteoglycan 5b isoform X2 [Denticeps clupeoides]|uniref:chondroitin sulfate proteoglycan 5b isoform X2 n=1 Tax=Denticeps clupeoides TaxID=299321 RepID=UPI0010A440A5|nr:chondroitin sulfate proteoglycan 5-like isoform X2 [Denticeps clupeoides]